MRWRDLKMPEVNPCMTLKFLRAFFLKAGYVNCLLSERETEA